MPQTEEIPIQIWRLGPDPLALTGAVKVHEGTSKHEPADIQAELHRAGKRDHLVIDGRRLRRILWS